MLNKAIPDLPKLLDAVMARATSRESSLHGEAHWKCVAWTGLELCRAVPQADCAVVFLFGLLHDTHRLNDGFDPLHGRRAGAYARELHERLILLPVPRLETLVKACDGHADGSTSPDDLTVGVCWDADRMNLWRVGMRPDPRYLSTEPAKERERIIRAERLEGKSMSWDAIYQTYAKIQQ